MPFLIYGQRQRGVDKPDDFLREVRRAAVADPLRIAAADHEASRLEGGHVAGHAGLARTEFTHQFANTMLTPIPHQPEGFDPDRLCESGENHNWIHVPSH